MYPAHDGRFGPAEARFSRAIESSLSRLVERKPSLGFVFSLRGTVLTVYEEGGSDRYLWDAPTGRQGQRRRELKPAKPRDGRTRRGLHAPGGCQHGKLVMSSKGRGSSLRVQERLCAKMEGSPTFLRSTLVYAVGEFVWLFALLHPHPLP